MKYREKNICYYQASNPGPLVQYNFSGCKPPAGSILSDCTSKGKKYTICTAKCANGNEGEWRTRCSKKKGKYIWDSIAAKVEAACN